MNKLAKTLSVAAAGVVVAGSALAVTTASASVTACPDSTQTWTIAQSGSSGGFYEQKFIDGSLTSSTTNSCTYNGTQVNFGPSGESERFANQFTFRFDELSSNGAILRPTFFSL
jgi:hypothetical protein